MKRAATILVTLAALAPWALPAPEAGAASPWWQLLSGSRPTNLQLATDTAEVQEVKTTSLAGFGFAAVVEVGGEALACLGVGAQAGQCTEQTGLAPISTAAALEEALEAPYGPAVAVSGGPVGSPFLITTPVAGLEDWVAPVSLTPLKLGATPLGSASVSSLSKGSGRLTITLTNLGNAPVEANEAPLRILDRLPAGAAAFATGGEAGWHAFAQPLPCAVKSTALVECTYEGELRPYEAIEVEVFVALDASAGSGEAGEVSVSGGEDPEGRAVPQASVPQTLHLSDDPVPFGLEYFSIQAEGEGGPEVSLPAAGAHPFQLTTTVVARSGRQEGNRRNLPPAGSIEQPALPRNLRFTLPAGLVGDATAVKSCDMATFLYANSNLVNECPDAAAIGVASVTIQAYPFALARLTVPVFNLPPRQGEPARFGLMVAGAAAVIDTSVDPSDEYRITAEVRNVPQTIRFLASTTTLWGDPGAAAHDASRGWNCAYTRPDVIPGECEAPGEREDAPFLRMPVSCSSPLAYAAAFEPWNTPPGSLIARASSTSPAPVGCSAEPFDPSLSLAPTSRSASSPTGLEAVTSMPNSGLQSPQAETSEAQFKRAVVTLPEGMTVNPSAAEGLAVCSQADYERERYDSGPGEGCPEASKIGSVQISTPLLEERAEGALYQAAPYENPTGGLLAVYLIARIPARGILVRQVGEVSPDPATGRLITTFDDVPQVPFDHFRLRFREGGRAPLITPPGCGTFQTTARFVPWSAADPERPAPSEVVERSAPFEIESGPGGGGCPSGPAPFDPGFQAGTESNQAGSYSPFEMRITRADGEEDLTGLSATLPPGVVGKIAGVPYCPEAGIARATARTGEHGGREELEDPSCPAQSQIGHTVAGAGAGADLTYVRGSLYLAGPYRGDPLSVVSVTPALAGPFDAGTVVVRFALTLNPVSGEVEVDGSASDPIPHILKGIPLSLRDLRAYVDRPDFTLNATSCAEEQTRAELFGGGTVLAPLAEHPLARSARYQAAGCRALGFKPRLAIRLRGGTRRGAHPALRAVVRPREGDANFSRAVVTLPHSAFLEQAHIRTVCTRVQFAAGPGNGARCPEGSVYGHARAWSPLLEEPLEGPVFLRSSSHKLPDLLVALHGLIDIDLAARIDSVHGGIRSTFANVPDAPVSRFVLDMQGARKGLIVNSRNLCRKPGRNRAQANLRGQNGRLDRIRPVVRAARCARAKRKRHGGHRGRG
jgi:hypothetical protein